MPKYTVKKPKGSKVKFKGYKKSKPKTEEEKAKIEAARKKAKSGDKAYREKKKAEGVVVKKKITKVPKGATASSKRLLSGTGKEGPYKVTGAKVGTNKWKSEIKKRTLKMSPEESQALKDKAARRDGYAGKGPKATSDLIKPSAGGKLSKEGSKSSATSSRFKAKESNLSDNKFKEGGRKDDFDYSSKKRK